MAAVKKAAHESGDAAVPPSSWSMDRCPTEDLVLHRPVDAIITDRRGATKTCTCSRYSGRLAGTGLRLSGVLMSMVTPQTPQSTRPDPRQG